MKNVNNEWFCDGCGEFIDCGNVRYADDGVQLCEVCYEKCRAASVGAQKTPINTGSPKLPHCGIFVDIADDLGVPEGAAVRLYNWFLRQLRARA